MYSVIRDALRQFSKDERGNVFILFAASAIPLFMFMGGAVDFARYNRYKADLANAVDSATLALARTGNNLSEEEATIFVANYVRAFPVGDSEFAVTDFDVDKLDDGWHVNATGEVNAMFLPVNNVSVTGSTLDVLDVDVVAEVKSRTQRLELAFVFDNTGSMNCGNVQSGNCASNWSNPGPSSRIEALKTAATTLVNSLMPDEADERIKIGLVPFEGDVNVGPDVVQQTYSGNAPSWLDWSDQAAAKYTGQNLGLFNLSANAACTSGSNCKRVGHKWLFNKLTAKDPNVKWAGCVEMRAEPYDILDTEPTSANADTLFVPRFWPDEPDSNNDDGDSYDNNYLVDKISGGGAAAVQKSLTKYTSTSLAWQSGRKDTTFPYEYGPNRGCPRPMVPLTTSKTTVQDAIDDMLGFYSTGTFIPTGLIWGWQMLTHTAPLTEGIDPSDPNYKKTLKAVVLFTDGENVVTNAGNHNRSRFSGYNYTGLQVGNTYRLGSPNPSIAVNNMDTKTAALCENVKSNATPEEDDDIRLYTITFGQMSAADEALMRNCASLNDDGDPLYFHAPTTGTLQGIFDAIGNDLSEIYLSM